MMKWLQWTPDRNGILGSVFILAIIVCVLAVVAVYLPDIQGRKAGFGPDWDCVAQPKGDPVCVKKPGR